MEKQPLLEDCQFLKIGDFHLHIFLRKRFLKYITLKLFMLLSQS